MVEGQKAIPRITGFAAIHLIPIILLRLQVGNLVKPIPKPSILSVLAWNNAVGCKRFHNLILCAIELGEICLTSGSDELSESHSIHKSWKYSASEQKPKTKWFQYGSSGKRFKQMRLRASLTGADELLGSAVNDDSREAANMVKEKLLCLPLRISYTTTLAL
jgi:hypothetical protein